jgi:hypothetical protein
MNGYKNNIREDSREAEYEGVDWIYVFRSWQKNLSKFEALKSFS